MKVLTIVGTRPQLIKAAAVQPLLRERHTEIFVDTGQHYDHDMAGSFFGELGLAEPDYSLGVVGASRASQVGQMLVALEPILSREQPDIVVVYGDTNSTLAGALSGVSAGVPVAHIEAGLRSFDRQMPEEINRVVADHVSTLLFAPTNNAVDNLAAEGITRGVVRVGDVLRDLCARSIDMVRRPEVLAGIAKLLPGPDHEWLTPGGYLLATVHRAENRRPEAVAEWLAVLERVASPDRPVLLLLHPGTRDVLASVGRAVGPHTFVAEPLGYESTLALQLHAAAVLTDSGGVQREAAWLDTPCLILRSVTEWVEALASGGSKLVLVGRDARRVREELDRLVPIDIGPHQAAERARNVRLESEGATRAIVEHLSMFAHAVTPRPPVFGSRVAARGVEAHGHLDL